ncbi:hypothetical protein BYT27DRAFT_7207926 [Phlegmacium glaucopus]|nr:hypothetical protein BYT27DRAFT_7207926 [Phlegmacium glaucopus]
MSHGCDLMSHSQGLFIPKFRYHVCPEDGKIYKIKNSSEGTYADMALGLTADGNPVVGFQDLSYNDNRKWKYINKGSGEFELENQASKTYAAHDTDPKEGSEVYGHSTAKVFRLIDCKDKKYNIRVKDKDLTCFGTLGGVSNESPAYDILSGLSWIQRNASSTTSTPTPPFPSRA